MAGYNPYQTNSYQATQFFPQPQGNVYIINNSMEIANIPVGGGISVALCPSEAIMFLKSMQNGAPTLLAYTLTPCEARANQRKYNARPSRQTSRPRPRPNECAVPAFSTDSERHSYWDITSISTARLYYLQPLSVSRWHLRL